MIDGIAAGVRWDQIALSVFLSSVFVRDALANRDSEVAIASSVVALVGCVLLAVNGVARPDGLALLIRDGHLPGRPRDAPAAARMAFR